MGNSKTEGNVWNDYMTMYMFMDPEGNSIITGKSPDWVELMGDIAAENGAQFHFNEPLVRLEREEGEDGRCTGVITQHCITGAYRRFKASKGILLAAGDFFQDKEMVHKYCRHLEKVTMSIAEPNNSGDTHKAALWIGAEMDDYIPVVDFIDSEFSSPDTCMKMSIVDAADRLLKARPFEKVSVGDICREANISRRTFYNHFEDKASMINWLGSYIFCSRLVQVGISFTWEEAIFLMLRDICANVPNLGRGTELSKKNTNYFQHCRKNIEEALVRELRRRENVKNTESLRFQAAMLPLLLLNFANALTAKRAFPGTFQQITAAGMEIEAPDEATCRKYASLILEFIPDEIKEAMLNPRIR